MTDIDDLFMAKVKIDELRELIGEDMGLLTLDEFNLTIKLNKAEFENSVLRKEMELVYKWSNGDSFGEDSEYDENNDYCISLTKIKHIAETSLSLND